MPGARIVGYRWPTQNNFREILTRRPVQMRDRVRAAAIFDHHLA